jgi:hypothetical protein
MRELFYELSNYYKNNDFENLLNHEYGIYFLKLKSLSRVELLKKLATKIDLDITNIPRRQLFEYIFYQKISDEIIDQFISEIYESQRAIRRENEDYLYNQLYRLSVLYWGGFYQNSVEQTIVNNYVKKIQNFDEIVYKIENDINLRLKGYILSSWYNHWASILIEDIFKDHSDIIPAIGLVKKIDFFWKNFPFDLKVTYFPDGYMKYKRKELGLRPELTELKQFARKNNILINKDLNDRELFLDLLTKISEHTTDSAKRFLKNFYQVRRDIINRTIEKPDDLIRWFYENQGIRRFDSANRFFIVLIDKSNLEDSWKLKRNRNLLFKNINLFLDRNRNINFDDLKLRFQWNGRVYTTYATCLFIIN